MDRDFKITTVVFFTSILFFGCKKDIHFTPISGGFGIGGQWIGIDSGPSAAMYYQDTESNLTLVWPYLSITDGPLFSNNMTFFAGIMPDREGRMVGNEYFAAQGKGPVLEISENILRLWTEANHYDFEKFKSHYRALSASNEQGKIKVCYLTQEIDDDIAFSVTWEQVSNIIQDVKLNGKPHEIKNPHVVYLKKDYGP